MTVWGSDQDLSQICHRFRPEMDRFGMNVVDFLKAQSYLVDFTPIGTKFGMQGSLVQIQSSQEVKSTS